LEPPVEKAFFLEFKESNVLFISNRRNKKGC